MDRLSNLHVRSVSTASAGIRRATSSSSGNRNIAKAAAQRLAIVMAQQATDDDGDYEEDDDDNDDGENSDSPQFQPPVALLPSRKKTQSPSPTICRHLANQTPPILNPIKISPLSDFLKQRRMSIDFGNLITIRDTAHQPQSHSVLQEEIDMLQEETEYNVEKLRVAEERCEEAEIRVQQLLKQLSMLGENASQISPEDTKNETSPTKNEQASALTIEIKDIKNETEAVLQHLHKTEEEIKHLRTTRPNFNLTQDQMEEMVVKKCWLARYWKLCVDHGILVEISEERHGLWSSQAPSPLQSVLSAGNKARDETSSLEKSKKKEHIGNLNGGGDIENLILVEKGQRELASLKVEDAISWAMSENRVSNYLKVEQQQCSPDGPDESRINSVTHLESLDLTQEECEQVSFKQAWLTYFWRRAKDCGVEVEKADERLKYWIRQSRLYPTNRDAIEVMRGLLELRKMGIETKLWQSSSS